MSIAKPSLTVLAATAAALVAVAAVLILVVAPEDAHQGFSQNLL